MCKTLGDLEAAIRQHEFQTSTKYVFYRGDKAFHEEQLKPTSKTRIQWDCTGTPFFKFGSRTYLCHQGKDINRHKKENYATTRDEKIRTDGSFTCRKKKVRSTKKLDCPAQIFAKRVLLLKQYQLSEISDYRKKSASQKIKYELEEKHFIEGEDCFIFTLPKVNDHYNHPVRMEIAVAAVDGDRQTTESTTGDDDDGEALPSSETEGINGASCMLIPRKRLPLYADETLSACERIAVNAETPTRKRRKDEAERETSTHHLDETSRGSTRSGERYSDVDATPSCARNHAIPVVLDPSTVLYLEVPPAENEKDICVMAIDEEIDSMRSLFGALSVEELKRLYEKFKALNSECLLLAEKDYGSLPVDDVEVVVVS